MFNNETRAERDLKIDKELNLQEYLTSEDFLTLKMAMSGQHKEIWTHKRHPDEDRLCEEATKVRKHITTLLICHNHI